jgi:hypothetical protein
MITFNSFLEDVKNVANDADKTTTVKTDLKRQAFSEFVNEIAKHCERDPLVLVNAVKSFQDRCPGWKQAVNNYNKKMGELKTSTPFTSKEAKMEPVTKATILQVKD